MKALNVDGQVFGDSEGCLAFTFIWIRREGRTASLALIVTYSLYSSLRLLTAGYFGS
jgi:hypothetical protein